MTVKGFPLIKFQSTERIKDLQIVNSSIYAMQVLQSEMTGEAERVGLTSDDDVMALVKELRSEDDSNTQAQEETIILDEEHACISDAAMV